MGRLVCEHVVPIDMECADCKLEWLGHENEKDAEIGRLREALEEISATFNKPPLMREASMIAHAALKPQRREG